MAITDRADPAARQAQIIAELLHDQGIDRYGLFLVSGEGEELPGGGETASGYVVDPEKKVFFFWLNWDQEQDKPVFSTWQRAEPSPDWLEDAEYRQALEAAGVVSG